MIKRFFTVLISIAIAYQSLMSFADVDLHHYSEAEHHEVFHGEMDSEKQDPADTPSQKNQDHAEHCHHGHSHFQAVLTDSVTDIPELPMEILSTDFQINFTTGVRSSLYRPPIS